MNKICVDNLICSRQKWYETREDRFDVVGQCKAHFVSTISNKFSSWREQRCRFYFAERAMRIIATNSSVIRSSLRKWTEKRSKYSKYASHRWFVGMHVVAVAPIPFTHPPSPATMPVFEVSTGIVSVATSPYLVRMGKHSSLCAVEIIWIFMRLVVHSKNL